MGFNFKQWLAYPIFLSVWSVLASFGTYACMYGFRKPFTAATFEEDPFSPGMKVGLVAAQVLGYMVSKFIGIKVIAEMQPGKRVMFILGLIGFAEAALLLFALAPISLKPICLFLNGLPLGMVFGLVLGFLEGRQLSEAFVAGLCTSFILADGLVKSVGAWVLESGVSEEWMPAASGALFFLPLLGFVWMLAQIPTPTSADVALRSERAPMSGTDRWNWIRRYGLGIGMIVLAYLLITVLRSLRADFAPELWRGLGRDGVPSIFTASEFWVALGVLVSSGLVVFIRNNRKAFFLSLGMAITGLLLVGLAVTGRQKGVFDGFSYMVLMGFGLYVPYVVVHTTVFERLIAMTRERGNVGYLMYLADAFGYLGYVFLIFFGDMFEVREDLLGHFERICWWVVVPGGLCFAGAWIQFWRKSSQMAGV